MSYYFHKMNKSVLGFDVNKDYKKIKLNHYIMRKVNLNNMKCELPQGMFKISIRSASSDLDIPSSTVYKLLKNFEVLNIIKLIKNGSRDHGFSIYKYIINEETVNKTHKEIVLENIEYSDTNSYIDKDNSHNKTDEDSLKENSNIENINRDLKVYESVIEYLNKKTNKNFKHKTNKTKSLINARLSEGFELNDFYKVIDIKSRQWLGNDMEKFLRPQTLFSNKFEGYLNEEKIDDNDLIEVKPWEVDFEY